MDANYHTHTWRCHHAFGTEREYIERAIEGGYKVLGFSDHTPQFYPNGFVDKDKMLPSELEGYVRTISDLRDEYKDQIEIHIGLEVEYYPAIFYKLVRFASQFPIEYFILGQHHLGNNQGDLNSFHETKDPWTVTRYVEQVIEGLSTGRFTYLAHPDLLNYTGDPAYYEKEMRRLCIAAKELDIPLEINFLGIAEHRIYPNPRFWKIAGEVGNTCVFGADAHRVDRVWNPQAVQVAEKIAEENHLTVLPRIPFVDPFAGL